MCGIVGAVTASDVTEHLLTGLKRLEYRGYDSAGIATLKSRELEFRKTVGKLEKLTELVAAEPISGPTGIGHTRWATHGKPSVINSHPHLFGDIALVHNGIVENYRELRNDLAERGHVFESETDTEIIPHLLQDCLLIGKSPVEAMTQILPKLEGNYAIVFMVIGHADTIFASRRGSPLVIGHGDNAKFIASDGLALAPFTNQLTYLEEGDCAVITQRKVEIRDAAGTAGKRLHVLSQFAKDAVEKGGFRHFMAKEIYEQPAVIRRTLSAYLDNANTIAELPFTWEDLSRLSIVACGSSMYAAQIAKYWFEAEAKLPVDIDISSEYRYRTKPVVRGNGVLLISQSGETADTLAALYDAKDNDLPTVSLVNVPESSLARETDATLHTFAGPEISVVSTKAFIAQLTALACLVMTAAKARNVAGAKQIDNFESAIVRLPLIIERILEHPTAIESAATLIALHNNALFIGRGTAFPLALEGALKLKEISYIHAEGFGAGELKHGSIALVDRQMPVIVIAPKNELFNKTLSNINEVKSYGAQLCAITDESGHAELKELAEHTVVVPAKHPLVAPIAMSVPLQLLAYHVAIRKGTDVDQPRNLAKSVTVE